MRRVFQIAAAVALFLCAGTALAQGTRYDGIALGERGAPVSHAFIAVCTQPAVTTTTPCSPLASLFTDATLTVSAPNPVTSDSLGNYHFYVAPGTYTLQTYGGQISPPFVQTDISIGSGGGGGGGLVAPNQNIIYVSPNCGTQTNCFPAKFDVQIASAASSTVSSTTVTTGASDPPFVAGDVGKLIFGTGHFTGTQPGLVGSLDLPLGTITTFVSAHQVTVSVAATATDTGTMYLAWGHDDTENLAAVKAFAEPLTLSLPVGMAIKVELPSGTAFTTKGFYGIFDVYGQGILDTTLIPLPGFDFTTGAGNSCGAQLGGSLFNVCFGFNENHDFQIYGLGQPISGAPNVVIFEGGNNDWSVSITGWGAANPAVTGFIIEPGPGIMQLNSASIDAGGIACETPPESGVFEADSITCSNDAGGTAVKVTTGITLTAHNLEAESPTGTAVDATAGAFVDDRGNFFNGALVGNITHTPTYATLTSGNCVQAGAGGLLATIASPCGTGSATLGTITPQPATKGDVVCANSTPTWTDCVQGVAGRTVSVTTDTIVATDRGTTIAYTSASAVAVTLTSAATLANNFYATVNAQGAGTVTLTPTAGQINGAASLAVLEGQTCYVHSADNVNYTADCSNGKITWGTGLTATPSAHGVSVSSSGSSAVVNGVTCGTCNLGSLFDTNGNPTVLSSAVASAVDQITVTNAATGGIPSIAASGPDATIPLSISGTGGGGVSFPSDTILIGGSSTSTAKAEVVQSSGAIITTDRLIFVAGNNVNTSQDLALSRDAQGILDVGTGAAKNSSGIIRTGNTVQLTSNFTTTSTSLVTITGLSWTFPNDSRNYAFHCDGSYSQATAGAADAFGVQATTTAPTNLMANMHVDTSLSNAGVNATLPTLTTTTATNIGTFTPSLSGAIGTVADILTFHIHGQLQQAAGATTLNIMALTGNASDALTIYAGTSCTLEP